MITLTRGTGRTIATVRLLVFSPYFPPHVGGLEGYVSNLDQVLLDGRRGGGDHGLHAAAAAERALAGTAGRAPPRRPLSGVRADPELPRAKALASPVRRALAAPARQHDLLVSHTRFFLSSTLALACARIVRRPLLHVEHGSDFVQLSGRAPRTAARVYDLVLGRWLLRHADGVIAISQAAADFVKRLAKRDASVVHRGMWTERLDAPSPLDGEVLAWADGRVVVTFAGRLIDGKGVADLVAAFARLDGEGAVLCVVGDGPRRADIEALAEHSGVAERVRMLGYLSEERAWSAIRSSDIVVNPSYTEGLPTSVLEAALMGGRARQRRRRNAGGDLRWAQRRPCPGTPPAELALALARLVEHPELRSLLGAAAREDAVARFNWEASARALLELAGELMVQPRRYQST